MKERRSDAGVGRPGEIDVGHVLEGSRNVAIRRGRDRIPRLARVGAEVGADERRWAEPLSPLALGPESPRFRDDSA